MYDHRKMNMYNRPSSKRETFIVTEMEPLIRTTACHMGVAEVAGDTQSRCKYLNKTK